MNKFLETWSQQDRNKLFIQFESIRISGKLNMFNVISVKMEAIRLGYFKLVDVIKSYEYPSVLQNYSNLKQEYLTWQKLQKSEQAQSAGNPAARGNRSKEISPLISRILAKKKSSGR